MRSGIRMTKIIIEDKGRNYLILFNSRHYYRLLLEPGGPLWCTYIRQALFKMYRRFFLKICVLRNQDSTDCMAVLWIRIAFNADSDRVF
jgi:hypothetical protein